jgi:hypothetical protein
MKHLLTFIFALALCWPAFGQTKSVVTPLATTSTDNGLLRYDGTTGQLVQAATGMTYSDNRALTIGGATLTVASEPILDLSQTWNNGAVTFTGLKYNVTDTASASGSLLMDLQVGGSSKARVTKAGNVIASNGANSAPGFAFDGGTNLGLYRANANQMSVSVNGTETASWYANAYLVSSTSLIGWSSGLPAAAAVDTQFSRESAAVIQMGADAATATAQKFKAHDGSGTDKAGADMTIAAGIGTGTASGGSLYLQTGGVGGASGSSQNTLTNRVTISPTGNVTIAAPSSGNSLTVSGGLVDFSASSLRAAAAAGIQWGSGQVTLLSSATGRLDINNNSSQRILSIVDGGYINGRTGSGTDAVGYQINIRGGSGTGTGAGGPVILETALSGSTGTATNSMSTRTYQNAKPVTLTESAATTIATIAVGSSKYVGAKLFVTVNADNATDFQAQSSTLVVNAVNKAGTVTPTITQVDGTTAASTGTLTATYTVTTSGNNVIIQCNALSSLTQTTLDAKWSIETLNSDDTAAVTVP